MPRKVIYSKTTITKETITVTEEEDRRLDGLIGLEIAGDRWKKVCLENMYVWKTMDEDITEESRKLINGTS